MRGVPSPSRPLSPGQVASIFGVTVTTVAEWADSDKLPSFKTPGGQRRFRVEDVEAFLGHPLTDEPSEATA